MNDKELNKGIQDLKNISLSQDEKKAMLSHISAYADFHAPKKAVEPKAQIWSFFSARSSFAASAFGLILVVSSTAYGAEKALPGDFLYPFKVNVSESVKTALLSNTAAKTAWESEKLIRRVEEAEALASLGKLDDASLLEVETRIDEHFEKLSKLSRKTQNDTVAREMPNTLMQAKSAAPRVETARVAGDAPEATTMMFSSFAVSDMATTTEIEKDEFELEIEKHRAILQNIKSNNNEQNERIDRLDKKLSEKAAKRAEAKRNEQKLEEIEGGDKINKSDDDSLDDGASVFESQRGKGKNKNR